MTENLRKKKTKCFLLRNYKFAIKRTLFRLPSGLCVGTAQTDKEGIAMRKLILASLVALILLLGTKAM